MTGRFINTIIFSALAIVMMAGCGEKEPEIPTNPVGNYAKTEIYGYITCEGKGLEGVTVSDGVEVVRTNAEGYYSKHIYGVAVFAGVESTLPVSLLPVVSREMGGLYPRGNNNVIIPENDLL